MERPKNCPDHRAHRGRDEIRGVYLSAQLQRTLQLWRVGNYSEKGWACTSHPHQPGLIFPPWRYVLQTAAVAALCVLCDLGNYSSLIYLENAWEESSIHIRTDMATVIGGGLGQRRSTFLCLLDFGDAVSLRKNIFVSAQSRVKLIAITRGNVQRSC